MRIGTILYYSIVPKLLRILFINMSIIAYEALSRFKYQGKDKNSDIRCATISAAQYIQNTDINYNLIAACGELEEHVINSIDKEELLTTEILIELSILFNNYAKALAILLEFKDLSNTLKVLSALLYNTALNDLSDENRNTLHISIESFIQDMQNWRLAIFIKQDASDIHYLDSKLLSSIDFHFSRLNKGKSYFFNNIE